jgi:hypothetical protein
LRGAGVARDHIPAPAANARACNPKLALSPIASALADNAGPKRLSADLQRPNHKMWYELGLSDHKAAE